jgi:hypothetical protein
MIGVPEDLFINEVTVHHFDVVVVGGGIAGVSIAERLAREARRRKKTLRIALVERAPELGEGSSGRLEGWFHTGALYSAQADGQTFMACVKNVERLINWYRRDPLFPFSKNCNFDLTTSKESRDPHAHSRQVPKHLEKETPSPWFLPESTIYYALRQKLERGRTDADVMQWSQQSQKISGRIHEAYWKWEWSKDDLAQAPPAEMVLKTPSPQREGVGDGEDYLERDPDLAVARQPKIEELLGRYERSISPEELNDLYQIYRSRDSVMDTHQILQDLTRSAAENGVEFLTGTEIREFNVPRYGDVVVTGLVGHQTVASSASGHGTRNLHLLANHYIFALGSGFNDEFLRKELGLRLRVETNRSVMAVIHPPLIEQNFVRMDYYPKNHFNHILRSLGATAGDDGTPYNYSMIANSAFDTKDTEMKRIAQSIEALLETACRYFPDTFYHDENGKRRDILWYQCNKTEFLSDDERKRNYTYWCEPEFGEAEVSFNPKDRILSQVERPRSIAGLISKLLHLILRAEIQEKPHHKEFTIKVQATIDSHVRQILESGRKPRNYLCVLPGKFTFFPLLAHQVYLEMESRGLYLNAADGLPPSRMEEPGVARPHPVTLLRHSQSGRNGGI